MVPFLATQPMAIQPMCTSTYTGNSTYGHFRLSPSLCFSK